MLAVIVFPHGFTTALASEAFIVPRASHRRITPTACLGRVLGAEPQVRCRCLRLPQLVRQLRVAPPSQNRTCPFTGIRLALYVFLDIFSIRECSCVELMVAVLTEDECFSVASGHHLLPQSFSFGDIFHLPDVVDLKRSLWGFTVFALPSVQP